MMRLLCSVLMASMALLLVGCIQPPVKSQVEAFSSTDAPRPGERVLVFPAVKPGTETLETESWVRLASAEFTARGFLVVSDPRQADLFAGVLVSMNGARDVTESYAIPQFGVTGYSGAYTSGSIQGYGNTATYQSNTTLTPTYGVTGYTTGVTTNRVFDRGAFLKIYRREANSTTPKEVFSAKALSTGSCGILSVVAPPIIRALFERFPQGGSGTVSEKWSGKC